MGESRPRPETEPSSAAVQALCLLEGQSQSCPCLRSVLHQGRRHSAHVASHGALGMLHCVWPSAEAGWEQKSRLKKSRVYGGGLHAQSSVCPEGQFQVCVLTGIPGRKKPHLPASTESTGLRRVERRTAAARGFFRGQPARVSPLLPPGGSQ